MKQLLKEELIKLLQDPEAVIVLLKHRDTEPQAILHGEYVKLIEHCWNARPFRNGKETT